MLGNFLSPADLFIKICLQKINLGIQSACHTVWIQIRPKIISRWHLNDKFQNFHLSICGEYSLELPQLGSSHECLFGTHRVPLLWIYRAKKSDERYENTLPAFEVCD